MFGHVAVPMAELCASAVHWVLCDAQLLVVVHNSGALLPMGSVLDEGRPAEQDRTGQDRTAGGRNRNT